MAKEIKLSVKLDASGLPEEMRKAAEAGLSTQKQIDPSGMSKAIADGARTAAVELTKATSKMKKDIERVFNENTGRYYNVRSGQTFNKQTGKIYDTPADEKKHLDYLENQRITKLADKKQKEEEKIQAKSEKAQERAAAKAAKAAERNAEKLRKDELKHLEVVRAKRAKEVEDVNKRQAALREKLQNHIQNKIAKNERMYGSDYSQTPSDFASAMDKFTNSQDGGRRIGALGQALQGFNPSGMLQAGVAITGAGSAFYGLKKLYAEREFREQEDLASGRYIESASRQAGRESLVPKAIGGVGGALAGGALGIKGGAMLGGAIGSIIPGAGTAVGAGIGGVIGGIGGVITGGLGGSAIMSNMAGEANVEQTRTLQAMMDEARRVSPLRQQAMAGGNLPTDVLNDIQSVGAKSTGYRPEETLQHLLTARGILGNKGAAGALQNLQEQQRFYGVDVGTGAKSIEALAGAGGTTRSNATAQQVEVLKKGVAAGLDVSKSGRFLQTTAQYLQESAGFGRVNTGAVTDRMAGFAKGFGGGEVTDASLQQAKSLTDLVKQESTATGGIAGAGNITAIQDTFRKFGAELDTGTMGALMNLSSDATEEDVKKILANTKRKGGGQADIAGMTKDIMEGKTGGIEAMMDKMGIQDPNLRRMLASGERSIRTEEQIRLEEVKGMKLTPEDKKRAEEEMLSAKKGVQSSKEFQLSQNEAVLANDRALAGLSTFTIGINQSAKAIDEFAKSVKAATAYLNSQDSNIGINRSE